MACKNRDSSESPKKNLIQEKINNTRVITFSRPKYMNSLTSAMIHTLITSLVAYEKQGDASSIIIQSQGNASFSAGGNLVEIYNSIKKDIVPQSFHTDVDNMYRVVYELYNMKTPVIAVMDGLTAGFGTGIGFCSKFKIATENTAIMMPETVIGHFTDCSTSYFLSRFEGNLGRYIALSASQMKAKDIMLAGMATHYVPSKNIIPMIAHITQLDSPSAKDIDMAINNFTGDWLQDGPSALCDKNALDNEGSKFCMQTKKKILRASPTAVKTTLELLCRASRLSFTECTILERLIWNQEMIMHDFEEGCRALLNKDTPQWFPKHLNDVDLNNDIRNNRFRGAQCSKTIVLRSADQAKPTSSPLAVILEQFKMKSKI